MIHISQNAVRNHRFLHGSSDSEVLEATQATQATQVTQVTQVTQTTQAKAAPTQLSDLKSSEEFATNIRCSFRHNIIHQVRW